MRLLGATAIDLVQGSVIAPHARQSIEKQRTNRDEHRSAPYVIEYDISTFEDDSKPSSGSPEGAYAVRIARRDQRLSRRMLQPARNHVTMMKTAGTPKAAANARPLMLSPFTAYHGRSSGARNSPMAKQRLRPKHKKVTR